MFVLTCSRSRTAAILVTSILTVGFIVTPRRCIHTQTVITSKLACITLCTNTKHLVVNFLNNASPHMRSIEHH